MKGILIVGATSAIASACARLWAAQGANLFLVGRNPEKLATLSADLLAIGAASAHVWQMDSNDVTGHQKMIDAGAQALGNYDTALIAHGTLPNQAKCENDPGLALEEFATNGTSVVALLLALANRFEHQQRCGAIGVITSVAGDRGRASNYLYGSAKAAVSILCEGMRARLLESNVTLTDIRPGFVATPMTAGLSIPRVLMTHPDIVASRIVAGLERGVGVLYVPAIWYLIMAIVRNLPGPVIRLLK